MAEEDNGTEEENDSDNKGKDLESLKRRLALQRIEIELLGERSEFLENNAALAESQLELAKERLTVEREVILEKLKQGDISEEEKKSLQERLVYLQNLVKLEGKRLQNINESKAAAENLNSVTSNYLGIITGINDGYKSTFLGSLVDAAATADGIQGAMVKLGKSVKALPKKLFANALAEIEQRTIGAMSAMMDFNATMVQTTGIIDRDFGKELQAGQKRLAGLGVSFEEVQKATMELNTGFTNFRNLSAETRAEMRDAVATFEAIGISAQGSVRFMDEMTKSFGLTHKEAIEATKSFKAFSDTVSASTDQLMSDFLRYNERLAMVGKKSKEVFMEMAAYADKTGQSLENLTGIASQFDTFEKAAETVGKLNTLMRGNYFDMQKLMKMDDAARVKHIARIVKMRFANVDSMSQQQVAFLKNALGAKSNAEALKMLRGEAEKGPDAFKEYGMTQEQVNELAQKSKTPLKVMSAALQALAIDMAPVVKGITEFVSWLAKAIAANSSWLSPLLLTIGALWGMYKVIMAMKALKGAIDVVRGISNSAQVGTTLAQAKANAVLAGSLGPLATAAAAAAAPLAALSAVSAPIAAVIVVVVAAIAVVVVALLDFMKAALEAGVGMFELSGSLVILGAALMAVGVGAPLVAIGIGLLAAALVTLGVGLLLVSTDDLQALATIFGSMAKTLATNPFGNWINGLINFAKVGDSVAEKLTKVGNAFAKLNTAGTAKMSPIAQVVKYTSELDDTSLQNITQLQALTADLRLATNEANADAINRLVKALQGAQGGEGKTARSPEKVRKEPDIVLKLDGDVLGRYVHKIVNDGLRLPNGR